MKAFKKLFHAGGVEQAVTSEFNLDLALKREHDRACLRLCEDLKAAGLLKVTEREISGDYTRQFLILTFPDLA